MAKNQNEEKTRKTIGIDDLLKGKVVFCPDWIEEEIIKIHDRAYKKAKDAVEKLTEKQIYEQL